LLHERRAGSIRDPVAEVTLSAGLPRRSEAPRPLSYPAPPAPFDPIRLLLDAHITAGTAAVPVAVDTHRAPVTLSRIAAHDVLFRCAVGWLQAPRCAAHAA